MPPDPALPPLDAEQIKRLRELLEATTQGEWHVNSFYTMEKETGIGRYVESENGTICQTGKTLDVDFIAESHNWFSRLLDLAERAAAMREALRIIAETPTGDECVAEMVQAYARDVLSGRIDITAALSTTGINQSTM